MSMSIGGMQGMRPQGPDPAEMRAKMKEGLEKLKKTNPELAEKMEKVDARMTELREAGTDQETAMVTVKSEFGELTDDEKSQLRSVMGTPAGPGGRQFKVENRSMQQVQSALLKALEDTEDDSDSDDSSTTYSVSAIKSAFSQIGTYLSSSTYDTAA